MNTTNQEMDTMCDRINQVLMKTGMITDNRDYRSLLSFGYQSVLVREVREGGNKYFFNAKISEINAWETGSEGNLIVEVIMASSSKSGQHRFVKFILGETNESTRYEFDPPFSSDLGYITKACTMIIT